MTAVERVLATASAEVGYEGHALGENLDNFKANNTGKYNKYARDLDKTDMFNGVKNGADWCAVFACWILWKTFGMEVFRKITGIPAHSLAAGVSYLADYFKAKGWFIPIGTEDPQPGDLVCYRNGAYWQHVGIVEKYKDGYLYTIEGNWGSPYGVHRRVNRLISLTLWGFCRPDYASVPNETPAEKPKEADTMTDEQFAAMMAKYLETHGAELATSLDKLRPTTEAAGWSEEARKWAVQSGLFSGDGNGNYDWGKALTREMAAVIFYKADQRK